MWLGEIATEKDWKCISMIIYAGIISRYPISIKQTLELSKTGAINPIQIIVFLIVSIAIIIGVILVLKGFVKFRCNMQRV